MTDSGDRLATLSRKTSLPVLVSFRNLREDVGLNKSSQSYQDTGHSGKKDKVDKVRRPSLSYSRLCLSHSLSLTSLLPSRGRKLTNTKTRHLSSHMISLPIPRTPLTSSYKDISFTADEEIQRFEEDFLRPLRMKRETSSDGKDTVRENKGLSKHGFGNMEKQEEQDRAVCRVVKTDECQDIRIEIEKEERTKNNKDSTLDAEMVKNNEKTNLSISSSSSSLSSDLDSGTFSRVSTPDTNLKSEESAISTLSYSSSSSPIVSSSFIVKLDKDHMFPLSPPPHIQGVPHCENLVTVNGKCLHCCQ